MKGCFAVVLAIACVLVACRGSLTSPDGGTTSGAGGATGGRDDTTGGAGSTGVAGDGGGTPFTAVVPCSMEASYATGSSIAFGDSYPGFNYAPKCLKVAAGATVTFNGDFAAHPLSPSTNRGMTSGNPITLTNTGTTTSFTFPTGGFYAYTCLFHGADDGQFMDGVIWVN